MKQTVWASLVCLGLMLNVPVRAQNAQDTAAAKQQLKEQQKTDQQQAKADKAEKKALGTKQQKKADKAQDKANKDAAKTVPPTS